MEKPTFDIGDLVILGDDDRVWEVRATDWTCDLAYIASESPEFKIRLLPQVPGKAGEDERGSPGSVPEPSPAEPTYPGLTYVGTAYGCRVHVDQGYDGEAMGLGTARRRAEVAGVSFYGTDYWCGDGADEDGEQNYVVDEMSGASKGIAVSPAGLRELDTWARWDEYVLPPTSGNDSHTLVLTETLAHTPASGETLEEATAPYEPQLLWGKPQIPDDRSTDLLEVVDGRVVLHLEESETHTGPLEGDELRDQLVTAELDVAQGTDDEGQELFGILHSYAYEHKRGWPVDLTAIRDAAERLNLALDWKANGARPAEHWERRGSANCEHGDVAVCNAILKIENMKNRSGAWIDSTRKASPWAPYEGE